MGQQNTLFTSPMLDAEPQQIHHHRRHHHHHHHHQQHHHPEPCMVCYGGVTCFPQPYNNHTILPPPGNISSFDPHYLPESHGQLPYVIAQYNSEHCNTFMIPSVGVFSVPACHDHLTFSNHHQMFERSRGLFMDRSSGAFKGHLAHGGLPIQTVPNAWLESTFSWNHAHGVPYPHGCMNGGGMEAGNMGGIHAYQTAAMTRNSMIFMHPPLMRPHQGPHNIYHPPPPPPPLPPVQAQNMDVHLQLPSTSNSHSTSTSTTYPFLNGVDPGPSFGVGPTPPMGLRLYGPHPHEFMIDSTASHHSFPHLRVRLLPEDELLALGEQIGNIDSGLSDNFISEHLKMRTFAASRPPHLENSMIADEEPNLCVICQMEFDDEEKIGILDCRHEYHVECIKKWLVVKNNCPICKSTALS